MECKTSSNKRLIINTLLLYFRMFILMGVSLYTSRVVLETLGVEDFGIYNVVGGLVTMFGLISNSQSSAISRYLNIAMGKGNENEIKEIFSTSVNIQILFSIIVIIIAELIGPWFISNKMTMPAARLQAAHWVFHCSIVVFVINLISLPYNACIIAHENMKIYAYLSILEALLKLGIVYILNLFSFDILKLYAILTLIVALIIRFAYQIYCRRNYKESIYKFSVNNKIAKEMFGFSSWNIIGNASVLFSNQGVNILINIFCNPFVNAANGIATQVNNTISNFSKNFMTALNPQIIKSFGAHEYDNLSTLMLNGSRFCTSLLIMLSLPFLIETDYIISVWLKQVPEYTCSFVQLILLLTISENSTNTYTTGILATGKIKWVMILIAGIRMLNFPLSWLCLKTTHNPEFTFIIAILTSQIAQYIRLILLNRRINIPIYKYYTQNIVPQIIIIGGIYYIHLFLIKTNFDSNTGRFLISLLTAEIIYITLTYYIICSKKERQLIHYMIKNKILSHVKKNTNLD